MSSLLGNKPQPDIGQNLAHTFLKILRIFGLNMGQDFPTGVGSIKVALSINSMTQVIYVRMKLNYPMNGTI